MPWWQILPVEDTGDTTKIRGFSSGFQWASPFLASVELSHPVFQWHLTESFLKVNRMTILKKVSQWIPQHSTWLTDGKFQGLPISSSRPLASDSFWVSSVGTQPVSHSSTAFLMGRLPSFVENSTSASARFPENLSLYCLQTVSTKRHQHFCLSALNWWLNQFWLTVTE